MDYFKLLDLLATYNGKDADENEARFAHEELLKALIDGKIEGVDESPLGGFSVSSVLEIVPEGVYIVANTCPEQALMAGDTVYTHKYDKNDDDTGPYIVRDGLRLVVSQTAENIGDAEIIATVTEVRRVYG